MIGFWEECIQNAFSAFSAFWEECIQKAFSARTKGPPRTPEQYLGISKPKPRTKDQDSPRTPEQILEFPNQTKNQDSPKTPEQILDLGSWF